MRYSHSSLNTRDTGDTFSAHRARCGARRGCRGRVRRDSLAGACPRRWGCSVRRAAPLPAAAGRGRHSTAPLRRRAGGAWEPSRRASIPYGNLQTPLTAGGYAARKTVLQFNCILLLFYYYFFLPAAALLRTTRSSGCGVASVFASQRRAGAGPPLLSHGQRSAPGTGEGKRGRGQLLSPHTPPPAGAAPEGATAGHLWERRVPGASGQALPVRAALGKEEQKDEAVARVAAGPAGEGARPGSRAGRERVGSAGRGARCFSLFGRSSSTLDIRAGKGESSSSGSGSKRQTWRLEENLKICKIRRFFLR